MVDYRKIESIIKNAGNIMKQELKNCDIYVKGRADFVTEADLKVQEYIFHELQKLYPQIGFIGEEQEKNDFSDEYQWILDPIDGTTNYIYREMSYRLKLVVMWWLAVMVKF